MKDSFKEQRNKAFKKVAIMLIAAWVLVSVAFSVIVYYIELGNMVKDEQEYEQRLLSVLSSHSDNYWGEFLKNIDAARIDDPFYSKDGTAYSSNMQIVASEEYKGGVIMDTDKSISVEFYGMCDSEYDTPVNALIDYNDFIASMTNWQYEDITKYLKMTSHEGGKVYTLVCTEFYWMEGGKYIKPKTVEIALHDPENPWYTDDAWQRYELFPKETYLMGVYKMDVDHCNIIPSEFITNEFGNTNLIEEVDTAVVALHSPEKIASEVGNYTLERVAPFTYVYTGLNTIDRTDEKGGNSLSVSGEESDVIYIRYAKKFNVMESAIGTIGAGVLVILLFFALVCFMTYIMFNNLMKAQAEAAEKRKELTSSLAHDIKTPLFIISGYAQNLKENINTDKRDHYIDRIIERTKEVNLIVHQMLNLTKLDSPELELIREDTDVEELLGDILTDYSSLPDNRTIRTSKKGNCFVFADKYAFNRAIRNIIDNAVKYSDKQTVINIEYDERALSISNVASGITKAQVEHLTEAYYRANNSREKDGSGLGLAAVKSIADMHGFKLEVSLCDNILTVKIVFRHK